MIIAFLAGLVVGAVAGVVFTFLFSRRNPKTVATAETIVKTVTGK